MAKPRFGRDAQVYVAPATYTDGVLDALDVGDLVRVAATKDISVTDEAAQMTASSRDWEYDVHAQGPKNYTIEFERNITLEEDGDDAVILREAYDDGTDIWVLSTNAPKEIASGDAILFIGQVFTKNQNSPQTDGAAIKTIVIRQANPDQEPEDVTTPYVVPDPVENLAVENSQVIEPWESHSLAWEESESGFDGVFCELRADDDDSPGALLASFTVEPGNGRVTFNDLTPDTDYWCLVRTENSGNGLFSAWVILKFTTDSEPE
jgi:hypothetical protein